MRMRVAMLALIVLAPVGPVEGAEIRFRGVCRPAGNLVRLGDVADIVSDDDATVTALKAMELCPTPGAGDHVVLTGSELCNRLALRGIAIGSHTFSGASRVTIEGAAATGQKPAKGLPPSDSLREQAEARVSNAVVEYLQSFVEATSAWRIHFELSDEQVRLVCRASAKPTVRGGQPPWTGEQQFQMAVASADSLHQFALSATITPAAPIVVARHAIGRGVVLNRADVELKTPTTADAADGAFGRLEDVLGRETVRSLSQGEPLGTDDVQEQLLVRRRDVVTVYVRCPGIRVRVTGRALEDGALGEMIAVESLADRKSFFARVSGAQEVEVYARAGEAESAGGSRAEAMVVNR